MKTWRKLVATVVLASALPALAADQPDDPAPLVSVDHRFDTVTVVSGELQTKFKSFWAPFGFTVGGAVTTGLGAVLLGSGAISASSFGPHNDGLNAGLLITGSVIAAAGLTLLTVGIIKFVQRSIALRERYGE